MTRKVKGTRAETTTADSQAVLGKEQEVLKKLLCGFKANNVNALVIIEKEGITMGIMDNGVTSSALVAFVVELFERCPGIFKSSMEVLHDHLEEASNNATVH